MNTRSGKLSFGRNVLPPVAGDSAIRRILRASGLCAVVAAGLAAPGAAAAQTQAAALAKEVPSVNAAIGPCSVEFTVNDADGKPVYDAKIRTHIAYGFMSVRKMDLEVGSNADGKARFDGLPQKLRDPLWFRARRGAAEGSASYNPAKNCQAEHAIVIIRNPS